MTHEHGNDIHALNQNIKAMKSIQSKPKDLWLAPTNLAVNELNRHVISALIKNEDIFHYKCVAQHEIANLSAPRVQTHKMKKELLGFNSNKWMAPIIHLAIGSRVRCVKNLGTQVGIFNGALGTIISFVFKGPFPHRKDWDCTIAECAIDRELPTVLVKMDEDFGSSCVPFESNVVSFAPYTQTDNLNYKGHAYHRRQVPLELAHASTVHKVQGITAPEQVIYLPCRNTLPGSKRQIGVQFGVDYTALSRSQSLAQIVLLGRVSEMNFTCFPKQRQLIEK